MTRHWETLDKQNKSNTWIEKYMNKQKWERK